MAFLIDPEKSLRVPGRMVADPTNLATAFPHGGTDLGLVRNIVFRPNIQTKDVRAEEFGEEVVEVIQGGESALLAVILKGGKDEMVDKLFPETFVGASSGDRGIRRTSTTRAGRLGSAKSFKLLFSPRNTTDHPGLIFYNAIPLIEETAELFVSIDEEFGFPAVFRAIRDTNGKLWEMQKLVDMSLT